MKKDFPIIVGQKEFLLRYNFGALELVEDLTGKSFFDCLRDVQGAHLKALKLMLFAGLRKNHPDVELDQVGEMLDEMGLQDGIKALIAAVENYFSKGKEDAKKKNPAVDSPSLTDDSTAAA